MCISFSVYASLVDISKRIIHSTLGLTACALLASIKEYKSKFREKKKKHSEIALLAKTNLVCIKCTILGF